MPGLKATRIDLTERQLSCLKKMVRRQTCEKRLVIRASIILAASDQMPNLEIAKQLKIDIKAVRTWRNRWAAASQRLVDIEASCDKEKTLVEAITKVLTDIPRRGTPATFTPEQIVQIVAISLSPPEESARPVASWTNRELALEAIKREIVETISPRSVGRFLKSGGFKTAS